MGDIVEFTTIANQQHHMFYKITSGSLRFQVHGSGDAGISLAKTPWRRRYFWIVIGHHGSTVVLKRDKQVYAVRTPQTGSSKQHREYCIQWYNNVITLANGDSDQPFFLYQMGTNGFKYITFASIGQNVNMLRWRFEMPPVLEKVGLKAISSGALEWKSVDDGSIPDGAFIGGYEAGELLYIIRAKYHDGCLVPGKYVRSEGIAYIPWERDLYERQKFEILCGYNCVWVPCADGKVPEGAVEGGYSAEDGEILYIGRALHCGDLIPGVVRAFDKMCYMAIDDNFQNSKIEYEILVVPDKNIHCSNPLLMYDTTLHESPQEYVYNEYDNDSDNNEYQRWRYRNYDNNQNDSSAENSDEL